MRMEKLKSGVSLRRAVQHNTRERKPSNADDERSLNNWTSSSSDEVMANYQGKLPDKVRANAVHAVEVVMTFGNGFYGDVQAYLKDCGKWVEDVFGKENTLHVAHHWDETTPHVHALVMPLKDGKLNAKHFIGGDRDRMAELQEDFFQKVGRLHGLDRGQPKAETKSLHAHHTLAGKITEADVIKKALEMESYHLAERTKGVELREQALKIESARMDQWGKELENNFEKNKAELKTIEESIAQGKGPLSLVFRNLKNKWQPDFINRVIDYSIKKFPEFIEKCTSDVLSNMDRKPATLDIKQEQSRGRKL